MMSKLYKAVKLVESNDNALAVRFENAFRGRISDKDKAVLRAKASLYAFNESIKAYLSFSIGRCQFLVYNLYFIDGLYKFLTMHKLMPVTIPFVVPDEIEFELFKIFISERMKALYRKLEANRELSEEELKEFAKRWNGSEAYYRLLIKHLRF
ncbi:MAG: hypothetical protein QXT86_13615 [Archaeoglobaceae archaeon]